MVAHAVHCMVPSCVTKIEHNVDMPSEAQAYLVGRRFFRAVNVSAGALLTIAPHEDERGYKCLAAWTSPHGALQQSMLLMCAPAVEKSMHFFDVGSAVTVLLWHMKCRQILLLCRERSSACRYSATMLATRSCL